MTYHKPVMLAKSVKGLDIHPDGVYVDLTLGGGGHSHEILNYLGKKGRLLGFDQDSDAKENAPDDPRFTFIRSNFKFLKNFLRYYSIEKVDGILADLGVSSHQIDSVERGFTYRQTSGLDMRMNYAYSIKASDILNEYNKTELSRIFRDYGELRWHERLSNLIIKQRQKKKFETNDDLIECVKPHIPAMRMNKDLSKIFQALRIEVNDELGALEELLMQSPGLLMTGGRMVMLTYHSLEDRMVKNFFKSGNTAGKLEKDFYGNVISPLKPINRNVIIPDEDEIRENPRSRSAKLRIAEKK